jgi:large subunit ribosomal protein L5
MSDVMRAPYISKVVVNIGVGEAGDRLNKAQRVLKMLTNHQPKVTVAKVTNRDLGVREGMPIGCKVTLRRQDADEFLRKALAIREYQLASYSYDPEGNLSFGISDYTDFEGMKYDPEIGIFGMDISVVFSRPGYRVARRRIAPQRIPKGHRITREETQAFMRERFNVEVVD